LDRIIDFIIGRKGVVLFIVIFITVIAALFSLKVEFDASIDIWFLENDHDLNVYKNFLKRFQADEVTVVGVFTDDIFTPENIALLDKITKEVEKAPHVHRVQSLTNIRTILPDDGGVFIGPLVDKLPSGKAQSDAIRKNAFDNILIAKGLVSTDSKAAAVVLELAVDGADFIGKVKLVKALEEIRDKYQTGNVKIVMSGTSVFDAAFYNYSNRDFSIFAPITFLLVLFACFFVFRRLSSTLIPLSVVVLTCLWTFGLMGALGIKINVLSTALAGLIMAVAIADAIHILADYYQELMKGHSSKEAARISIKQLLAPCFFTSITTSAGMLSLLASDLKPIREFGWLAAVAVTFAFLITFTFVPVVLRFAKPPDPAFIKKQKNGYISRLLLLLCKPGRKRSWITVIAALVLLAISGWFFADLDVGSNPMNYFRESDPVRTEAVAIDNALGGSVTVDFLVGAPDEGLKNPDILRRLDDFERWLDSLTGITQTLSIVDSLKEMNRVFHDGDKNYFAVPASRNMAAQFFMLLEGEDDFDTYVQENYSVARITSRINFSDAQDLVGNMSKMEQEIASRFPDQSLSLEMTGMMKLFAKMEIYLLKSQIRSFILAFIVITLMMMAVLRSVSLGLFSMIPNVMPIFIGLAFMAAARITLDVGTVMIGSIALGLVVDDSVHFLTRLKGIRQKEKNVKNAIAGAIINVGRPIIITSLVLAAGFSVLMLGSFAPNIYFGLICAIIILLALVFDLVVLPAALLIIMPGIAKTDKTRVDNKNDGK